MRYRMWLAAKLNEIKLKYREMATACLLRTRLAFVGEVQNYYDAASEALGEQPVLNGVVPGAPQVLGDAEDDEPQEDETTDELTDGTQRK